IPAVAVLRSFSALAVVPQVPPRRYDRCGGTCCKTVLESSRSLSIPHLFKQAACRARVQHLITHLRARLRLLHSKCSSCIACATTPLSCCRHPSVEAIKGLSGKTLKMPFRTIHDIKPQAFARPLISAFCYPKCYEMPSG